MKLFNFNASQAIRMKCFYLIAPTHIFPALLLTIFASDASCQEYYQLPAFGSLKHIDVERISAEQVSGDLLYIGEDSLSVVTSAFFSTEGPVSLYQINTESVIPYHEIMALSYSKKRFWPIALGAAGGATIGAWAGIIDSGLSCLGTSSSSRSNCDRKAGTGALVGMAVGAGIGWGLSAIFNPRKTYINGNQVNFQVFKRKMRKYQGGVKVMPEQ